MQASPMPLPPVADPAVPAETENRPAPVAGVNPLDGCILDELRARTECMRQAVRARVEWTEARRRELWARVDRLRGGADLAAADHRARGPAGFPD